MDKWTRTLKDIIDGVEHLPTLLRAAEISPYITERTIGPDLIEPLWHTKTTKETTKLKADENNNNENNDFNKLKEIKEKELIPSNKNDNEHLNATKKPCDNPIGLDNSTSNHMASSLCESKQHKHVQASQNGIVRHQTEDYIREGLCKSRSELRQCHNDLINEKLLTIQQEHKQSTNEWLEKKYYNDARIVQLAQKLTAQECQEYERQADDHRKRAQEQLQEILRDGILQYQIKINNKFEKISNFLMILAKYSMDSYGQNKFIVHEYYKSFEQLINKVNMNDFSLNELEMSHKLYITLNALEYKILELCKLYEQIELNGRQQLEQQQGQQGQPFQPQMASNNSHLMEQMLQEKTKVQEQQPQQAIAGALSPAKKRSLTIAITPKAIATTKGPPENSISSACLENYKQIIQFYIEKMDKMKILQSDDYRMKEYRFACQKSINIPVNTISGASKYHLADKYYKLWSFILSQQDPLSRDYCIWFMSKKFVEQAESTISNNSHGGIFPIASVIVTLWKQIPEFGQMFLANTFKASPFMVPYLPIKQPEQSFEEYAKLLGYRINNGQLEEQNAYLKRQAGIARLYAAIMITNGQQQHQQQMNEPKVYIHPYGLENAWRWLSSIIQLAPLPDICATVIMEFLNIAGHDLWQTYGHQFTKLLFYIYKYYLPKLSQMDIGGPKLRFEILLTNLLKDGKIDKPIGMLPTNFW